MLASLALSVIAEMIAHVRCLCGSRDFTARDSWEHHKHRVGGGPP